MFIYIYIYCTYSYINIISLTFWNLWSGHNGDIRNTVGKCRSSPQDGHIHVLDSGFFEQDFWTNPMCVCGPLSLKNYDPFPFDHDTFPWKIPIWVRISSHIPCHIPMISFLNPTENIPRQDLQCSSYYIFPVESWDIRNKDGFMTSQWYLNHWFRDLDT